MEIAEAKLLAGIHANPLTGPAKITQQQNH
jgi:hypothetical protein